MLKKTTTSPLLIIIFIILWGLVPWCFHTEVINSATSLNLRGLIYVSAEGLKGAISTCIYSPHFLPLLTSSSSGVLKSICVLLFIQLVAACEQVGKDVCDQNQ